MSGHRSKSTSKPLRDARDVARDFFAGTLCHQDDPLFQDTKCPLLTVVPGRVYFIMAFCNVIVLRTPHTEASRAALAKDATAAVGTHRLVLFDAGSVRSADHIVEALETFFSKGEFITDIVYTHGHIDHVSGTPLLQAALAERGITRQVRLWGHSNVNARFERYRNTAGYNARINARQFDYEPEMVEPLFTENVPVDVAYDVEGAVPYKVGAFDPLKQTFHWDEFDTIDPVDGYRAVVKLVHCKGETDDGTVAVLRFTKAPRGATGATAAAADDKVVLIPGDLWINCMPNCGNPQKAQRFPLEWASSLGRIGSFIPAGARPDGVCMLPGHGPLLEGKDFVAQALRDTQLAIEDLCGQALPLINRNMPLNDIVQRVHPRPDLVGAKPYLRPFYDEPTFIVRNLYRLYAGWYSGHLPDLHPVALESIGATLLRRFCQGSVNRFVAAMQAELDDAGTRPSDPAALGTVGTKSASVQLLAAQRVLYFTEMVIAATVGLPNPWEEQPPPMKAVAGRSDRTVAATSRDDVRALLALRSNVLTTLSLASSSLMARRVYSRSARDTDAMVAKL